MAVDIETIGVGVDTSGVKSGTRDLDTFGKSADAASRKADGLGAAGTKASNGTLALGKSALSASSYITQFGASIAGAYASFRQIQALINASDAFTKLSAQLKLATDSQLGFAKAYEDVQRIAKTAQADISATTVLYARLSNALKDLGASQKNIADVTETISLALKVSGSTAAEASSVMLQLSQAFGSGVLRGEEFNAAMEAAPNLMRGLAESMGVPIGKLREMAKEGQITSDILLKAFGSPEYLSNLREQAKEINTIGGALQNVGNQATLLVGELNEAQGVGWLLARSLEASASALQRLREEGGRRVTTSIAGSVPGLQGAGLFADILAIGNKSEGPSAGGKITTAAIEASASIKALNDELAKFIDANPLKDHAAKLSQYNERIAELVKFEKAGVITSQEAARYRKQFHDELTRGTNITNELAKAKKELADAENIYLHQQMEDERKLIDQEEERFRKLRQQQADAIDAMSREVAGWNDLSEAQHVSWDVQTGRYKDFDVQSKEELLRLAKIIDARNEEAKSIQRMADLQDQANRNFMEAQDASDRAMRSIADDAKRMAESINESLTDALLRGFESGKDFAQNFIDTLKNMFQTLVLRPVIQFIMAPLTGAISATLGGIGIPGVASAAEAGGGGMFGLGGVLDAITKGNAGIVSGIENLGSIIADGAGGLRDAIGGFMGQYSGGIATALPFLPAAFSLLSGNVKDAAFQGAGAAIGTALGGPVGGAIGSVLGGAVGGLFGNSKGHRAGAGTYGYYSNGAFQNGAVNRGSATKFNSGYVEGLQGLNQTFASTIGNFLDSLGAGDKITSFSSFKGGPKHSTVAGFWSSIGNGSAFTLPGSNGEIKFSESDKDAWAKFVARVLGEGLAQAVQHSSLGSGIKSLFDGLTDQASVQKAMQSVLALNSAQKVLADRFGLTVEQAAQVSKATGKAGDDLVAFTGKLATAAGEFRTAGSALTEVRGALAKHLGARMLSGSVDDYDAFLKGIDKTTAQGRYQFSRFFEMRDQFAQYSGAISALKGGVKGATFGLLSPAEQQAQRRAELDTIFNKLGADIPGSVQELIDLGKSIDYTTEAGINLAAAFPSLVSAFTEAQKGVDGLVSSLGELDINRFRTLVDYTRAQRYQDNGISMSLLPSYDVGTDYVPATGPALLHLGEAVLQPGENARLSRGMSAMVEEVGRLRRENQAQQVAIAIATQKMAKVLDRIDSQGVILSEIDNTGARVTLDTRIVNTGAAQAVPVDTTP